MEEETERETEREKWRDWKREERCSNENKMVI